MLNVTQYLIPEPIGLDMHFQFEKYFKKGKECFYVIFEPKTHLEKNYKNKFLYCPYVLSLIFMKSCSTQKHGNYKKKKYFYCEKTDRVMPT